MERKIGSYAQVLRAVKEHQTFLVTTHINPDADAIASQLSLAALVRSLGKKVLVVNAQKNPQRFSFLSGSRQTLTWGQVKGRDFQSLLIVDCGDLKRIGEVARLIRPGHRIINIDHHLTNEAFGQVNLVDSTASSTSEIIYQLLKRAGQALDRDLATLLYVGIMTDTGSFRYDNTTSQTHRIVADLLRYKVPVGELYRRLYETIPLSDMNYFNEVVRHIDPIARGRVICVELRKKTIRKFTESFDLRDKIFRYLRAVKGVEVLVIFTEDGPSRTRVNMRSLRRVNVGSIAYHFQGGGHSRASGCVVPYGIPRARKEVLKVIRQFI